MRSVHQFKPGDKVEYSIVLNLKDQRGFNYSKHLHGRGIVLQSRGGAKERPAYLIRTPQGLVKIVFANELKLTK